MQRKNEEKQWKLRRNFSQKLINKNNRWLLLNRLTRYFSWTIVSREFLHVQYWNITISIESNPEIVRIEFVRRNSVDYSNHFQLIDKILSENSFLCKLNTFEIVHLNMMIDMLTIDEKTHSNDFL